MESIAESMQARTDDATLQVLLVEFLRSTNVPFSAVDDPMFKELCQFLNPNIRVPSSGELIKMNMAEMDTFRRISSSAWSAGDRKILIEKWALLVPDRSAKKPVEQPEELLDIWEEEKVAEEQKLDSGDLSTLDSEGSKPENNLHDLFPAACIRPFKRPLTNQPEEHQEKHKEKKSVEIDTRPAMKLPRIEIEEEYYEDEVDAQAYLPGNYQEYQVHPDYQDQEYQYQDEINDSTLCRVNSATKRSKNETNSLSTLSSLPGVVRYPCLYCQARMDTTSVRAVTNNNAYIMIYLGVLNEKYSMETARDIAKMQKFRVCAAHLDELYDSALHHFNIVDPKIDVCYDNSCIAEAFEAIRIIKDSQRVIGYAQSAQHTIPFCQSISRFLSKYKRKGYVGYVGELE